MFKTLIARGSSFISNSLRKSVVLFQFHNLSTSLDHWKNMKIGTHDGLFHCDEVLACYLLKRHPKFKDAEIIRSRDPEKLDECDIVVDVGGVFNHKLMRYDHHQREFTETFSSLRPEFGDKYQIKLSSAGLVYTYYGEDILSGFAPGAVPMTTDSLKIVFVKVYEALIQEVDAIDNGVLMTDTKPRYNIRTNLSARVARLNPAWNSKLDVDINHQFNLAMETVGEEFLYAVNSLISVWLPARDFVKSAVNKRFEVHESGSILEFCESIPWKEHLFDIERELGLNDAIKFVLFSDKPNSWRVQAVPVEPNSFALRKPLHKAWWGIRDEELTRLSGVRGCIFCHGNGFIGGNKTRNGALKMAILSLEANEMEEEVEEEEVCDES